jgi:hypothetical protein
MSQFTPGPWEIHDGGRFGQYGDLGPSICAPTGPGTCQPLFELAGPADPAICEANARLIAAAPSMYAFLIKVANLHNNPWMTKEALAILREIDATIEVQP